MRIPWVWLLLGAVLCPACSTCGDGTALEQATPLITPSSSEVEFGDVVVGGSRVREVRMQSSGTGTLHIQSASLEGDAVFAFQEPLGPVGLTPNASQPMHVVFHPALAGPARGTLVVVSDAENLPTLRITLIANGTAAPTCDDTNPCTNDAFDPVVGVCLHVNNQDPCNSGSKCTHDDRCVDGQCRGLATACEDSNACTRNLCDPTVGCVFVPVLCEDGNTCTLDTCDPVRGCAHHAIPDGAPCEDGNFCSLGDQCTAGVCHGAPSARDPAQVGVAYSYGHGGPAAPLKDGRVLFMDSLNRGPGDIPLRATVATLVADRLAFQKSVELSHLSLGTTPELLENGALVAAVDDGTSRSIHVFTVGQDGTVRDVGSTPPLAATVAWFSHFGNVFYGLGTGFTNPALVVVDASNPAQPVLSTIHLTGGFQNLAVDSVHGTLLLVGSSGLTRFSLANPIQPVLLDVQVAGPGMFLAASDGTVTVTVTEGTGQFDVRSALTGELLRAIPYGTANSPNTPHSILLADQHLWAASRDAVLSVYDVDASGAEARIATVKETVNAYSGLHAAGLANGVVTVGSAVFRLGAGFLAPVSGPGHGTMGVLHNHDGVLVSASWDSVHHLDIADATAPRFVAGSSFERGAVLVSLSSVLRTPTLLVAEGVAGTRDPAILDTATGRDRAWMDAFDPNHPTVGGTVRFPDLEGIHGFVRSDGRRMYLTQATPSQEHPVLFDVINPDNAMGVGELELGLNAPLNIPSPLADSYPRPGYMAKDPAARHVALTAQERSSASNVSQVMVVDTADTQALSTLVSFGVPYKAGGVALAGALVAVFDESAVGTTADNVHVYQWDAAQPASALEVGALHVEGMDYFLLMDSHVLLMATATGVAYANVFAQPPVLMGQVPTPETRPRSALAYQDKLLLAFPGEVVVLSPPCPAAP